MKIPDLAILRTLFTPHRPSSAPTHTELDNCSSSNSPYVPYKAGLVTSSKRLERAAELGLVWGKISLFSVWGWVTADYKGKKNPCDVFFFFFLRVSTSRWQHPVGCHLLLSYLCPAQVGGGADLSFSPSLCFLLWGVFSWPRFDMAEPQPNNHSSDRGGCASLHPSIQGFGNSCHKGGWGGGG